MRQTGVRDPGPVKTQPAKFSQALEMDKPRIGNLRAGEVEAGQAEAGSSRVSVGLTGVLQRPCRPGIHTSLDLIRLRPPSNVRVHSVASIQRCSIPASRNTSP